jgi:hypothetical protein
MNTSNHASSIYLGNLQEKIEISKEKASGL